jgi:ketosteroid isomerase-like protein
MSVVLPTPIAIYIAAENRGDTEALAQCFAEDAVVRDEGQTIEGLAAIKQWKAETKKKYQHHGRAAWVRSEGRQDHRHQPPDREFSWQSHRA